MKKAILIILAIMAIGVVGCKKDEALERPQQQNKNHNNSVETPKTPVVKTFYEVVQVVPEKNFWVYSKTGAGSTRTATSFTIPENSIGLYHSFSTSTSKVNQVKNLNLLKQLKDIVDKNIYKYPMIAFSDLTVPDTEYLDGITVNLMNSNQVEDFMKGNSYYRYSFFEKIDKDKDIVIVTYLPAIIDNGIYDPTANRNFSLGFYNDNFADGVGVTIEVAAIVKKQKTVYE